MDKISIFYESINEVRVTKERELVIVLKNDDKCKKLKKHLLKQFGDDKIDV